MGAMGEKPTTSNRETGARPERPVAYIEPSLCDRSPSCPVHRICPKKAVVPEAGCEKQRPRGWRGLFSSPEPTRWVVVESKCSGCLLCAPYCPHRAVQARLRQAS